MWSIDRIQYGAMIRRRRSLFVPVVIALVIAGCAGDEGAKPVSPPDSVSASAQTSTVPVDTAAPSTSTTSSTSLAPTTTASPEPEWSLGEITPLGIEGVSPEIVQRADGSFLLLVTGPSGGAYSSSDGLGFTRDASVQLPQGADYSLLQTSDGTWRLYYIEFEPIGGVTPGQPPDPNNVLKVVKVSSAPGLDGFGPGQPTGIAQSEPSPAWGVPDTYALPDGRTAMMYVDRGKRDENILLATSTDGVTFAVEPEPVFTGGYVDPYVIELDDGSYAALLSTTPGRPPQRLHLATSSDGLTWTVDDEPFLVDERIGYLDPAAVPIGPGEWLLVISVAEGDPIEGTHELVVTRLLRTTG
jgi:hypothetical protein